MNELQFEHLNKLINYNLIIYTWMNEINQSIKENDNLHMNERNTI